MSARSVRWLVASVFVIGVAGLVGVTANDLGLTWDETPYRYSQELMARWFSALATCRSVEQARPLLTKEGILNAWEYNRFGPNFHPPLAGMLCNLTHGAMGQVMGDLPARRLASGIELGLVAGVLFLFLAKRYSPWVGAMAAASLLLMPRVFGHAHIAGTDLPLMAFWAFTALAFWKGLDSPAWRVIFGVLLGLSLLVKFTALLIVLPLGVWLLCYRIIPGWSFARVLVAVAATLFVGWPLGVAAVEIVRLASGIRLYTQQERMLGSVVEAMAYQRLVRAVQHAAPFTAQELAAAVQLLQASSATDDAGPMHASIRRELANAISHGQDLSGEDVPALRAALRAARHDVFLKYFQHGPPYTEAELKRAALELLGEVAAAQGATLEDRLGHAPPYSPRELKHVAAALNASSLALDQYVAYVMPKESLGVTTFIPGWVFFVPLVMWLVWHGLRQVPFMPAAMRISGAGLGLWLAGLAIAPAVAIALNPTWWHETLPQLGHYYQISVGRQGSLPDIEIFYLGKKFIYNLPWHNGWLLMAVTVPAAILAGAVVGLGSALWSFKRDPLRMFFLLNMITLPLSRMLPTPAHDGVRLMLPSFFFLAGLVGWGFELVERLVDKFRSEEYSTTPVLAVAAAFLLGPPAYWLVRTHPHELSYYNGFVGGLAGAQRAGFEVTYWYDAVTPAVVQHLNDPEHGVPARAVLSLPEPQSIIAAILPPDIQRAALLRTLPERRINPEVFVDLSQTGQLRQDIRIPDRPGVPPELSEFPHVALLTHSSKASPFTRLLYAFKPSRYWEFDGVRLFSLYDSQGVARAWGLWLLIDATDYSKPQIVPRVDRELIELARRDYRSFYAAALRISEVGLDQAEQVEDDPGPLTVIRKLAARRELVQILLARRKEALVEAVEILSRTAEKRPQLLERLVETYDGYLPASELGSYLDDG
jgi:hypothetical protein